MADKANCFCNDSTGLSDQQLKGLTDLASFMPAPQPAGPPANMFGAGDNVPPSSISVLSAGQPLVSQPPAACMGMPMMHPPGAMQGPAAISGATTTSLSIPTSPLASFLSAPAQTMGHTNLTGAVPLGPAAAVAPTTQATLLAQALQSQAMQASANSNYQGAPNSQLLHALGAASAALQPGFMPSQTLTAQLGVTPGLNPTTAVTMPMSTATPTSAAAALQPALMRLQANALAAMGGTGATMSNGGLSHVLGQTGGRMVQAPAVQGLPVPPMNTYACSSAGPFAAQPARRLPDRVKVLITYGGVSSSTTAGVWEYCGGETRLVGNIVTSNMSYADLAARVEGECHIKLGGAEGVLRYELPGCPGTLVDLKSDDDVVNMWSEWADFVSVGAQPGFKLHLYVDKPPMPARMYRGSGSGGSGGRVSGGRVSGGRDVAGDAILAAGSESAGSAPSSRSDSVGPLPASAPFAAAPSTTTSTSTPNQGSPIPILAAVGTPSSTPPGTPPRYRDTTLVAAPTSSPPPAAAPVYTGGAPPPPRAPGPGEKAQLGMFGGGTEVSFGSSFDTLLSRVRNTVEIIRPSELRIMRFIGSGGFADCYLAKWLGVEVAVKCFRDMKGCPAASSKAAVRELMREAAVLSGLRHPNVLCLYAVALPDALAYEFGVGSPPSAPPPQPLPPQEVQGLQDAPSTARATSMLPAGSMLPALTPVPEDVEAGVEGGGRGLGSPVGASSALSEPLQGASSTAAATHQASFRSDPGADITLGGSFRGHSVKMGAGQDEEGTEGAESTHSGKGGREGEGRRSRSPGRSRGTTTAFTNPASSPFAAASAAAAGGPGPGQAPLSRENSTQTSPLRFQGSGTLSPLPTKLSGRLPSGSIAPGARQPSQPLPSAGGQPSSGVSLFFPSPSPTSPSSSTRAASGSQAVASDDTMANNEDDDAMKKAVAAAEAASAASADAESQTALSQGIITRPALVAEFLSGCSLDSAIRRSADFLASDLVVTKVALDAARGMEYCHQKRVTHWNLKAGNLIVGFSADKVPLCKISDMGLSRPRQLTQLDEAGVARVLPWAAPELLRDPTTAGDKVDVYSFGMILWALWARKLPFAGQDIARVFMRMMQGQVVRPPLPGTPEWEATYPASGKGPAEPVAGWADLTCRCWAQQAQERPSFQEITTTMTTLFNAAKARKRAARAAAAQAGAGAGAGAGTGGAATTAASEPQPPR